MPSAKIKLVCKTFSVVTDPTIYSNITLASSNSAYNDPNAINVYCGACISPCLPQVPTPLPNNIMYFPQGTANNVSQKGGDFAHELGHNLGLNHPTVPENYSNVTSTFGCCNHLLANDVYLEQANPPWAPCNTPGASNNLLSQNAACQKYLSPLQMAIMHYHLRNSMYRVLTTTSKNYVTNVNTAFDLNITSSQTWTADRYMKGNITVKAGNTLTIKCWVSMAKDAKILVEKGAKLVIDGGTVTNFFTSLWKGVEVCGNSSQNQNVSGGYGVYQGYLNIINGGTLSNAQNAICTYTTNSSNVMDASSTGGIVICNTANFINNVRSAEFYYYYSPNGGNLGSFTKCNFNTTGALRESAVPSHHVTMYNVDGINFLGSNFEYSAGSSYATMARGNGIYSIDAKYFVDKYSTIKTTFKNLVNGIYADNSNPLRVVSVTNTEFYDNIYYSTYFNTMTTPVFTDNYVRTASTGFGAGLYLNNCKYYNVKNNTFLESSAGFANDVGIYVNNSTTGLHKIYRNSFANFYLGINAQNDNSGASNTTDGLKMNCNDFTPSANLYDIVLTGASPSVMKTQGAISAITPTNVVRNIYGATSGCSNCENKWYISAGSKIVDHGSNSNTNTRPTPQPQNSDILVNVVNSGISLDYVIHCPLNEETGGGGSEGSGRLANINNYIQSLVSDNSNAKGTNPTGEVSEQLKSAIYAKLNYFLMDSLPASKDSVIALLQNNAAGMDDADVLLTYAYINKGDFNLALQNANSLINKNDWKALQQNLIGLHQHPEKAYALKSNGSARSFLENYVTTTDKDGLGAAQSILKFATGQNYFIPHLVPFVENGVNKSINNPLMTELNSEFSVYPNPASQQLSFAYNSNEEDVVHVAVINTFGKIVYEGDVRSQTVLQIGLHNIPVGVYILTAAKGKEQVYQAKVICVK
ncbi:MAG: T9SS type A sorting domain-containing protein [Bacteroidetes bacterium]|nr:T9SS type A sorting domain-containing protein [Bacteroidota bacterium]